MESIDNKVEIHCNLILKTDAEDWDKRNKAILQLTELVQSYENRLPDDITNAFTNNVYRSLKEPIKVMILDLRSQQVRDTCLLLMKLAEVTGDRMKTLLRDVFTTILDGVKIPNKVMSGYIDDCIQHMIKYVTFKQSIAPLAQEVKESKSKVVREKCLEYINSILVYWDLSDKDLDLLIEPIKLGLEDASLRGREIARAIYLNMYNLYPLKASKIKTSLSKPMQTKLTKAEEDGNFDSLNNATTHQGTAVNNASNTNILEKVSNNSNSSTTNIPSTPNIIVNSISSSSSQSQLNASTGNIPQKRSTSVSRSSCTSIQSAVSIKTTMKNTSTNIKNTLNRNSSYTSSVQNTPVAKDFRSSSIHSSNSKSNLSTATHHSSLSNTVNKTTSSSSIATKLNHTPSRAKINLSSSLDSIAIKKSSLQSSFNSSGNVIKIIPDPQPLSQQRKDHKDMELVIVPTLDDIPPNEEEAAAVAIQARIRGTFTRRKSVVINPFLQLSASSPVNTSISTVIAPPSAIDRAYLAATGNKSSLNHNIVNKNSNTNNAPLSTILTTATAANKKSFDNTLPLPEFSTSTTTYMPPAPPLNVNKAKVINTVSHNNVSSSSTNNNTSNSNNVSTNNIRNGGSSEGLGSKPVPLSVTKETSVSKLVSQWESVVSNNTITMNQAINKANNTITSTYISADINRNNERLSNSSDSSVHFPKHLSLNMHVLVNTDKDVKLPGIIRFIGLTSFSSGVWIGIELFSNQGKNNGIIQGRYYFECKPNYGIFVREDAIYEIINNLNNNIINNNMMNNHSEYDANYNKHIKSTKITAVLKLKISQLMEMLNEQIQIVETLEEEDRKPLPNTTITEMFHKKVLEITNKEQKLIEGFKAHLIDRLNE